MINKTTYIDGEFGIGVVVGQWCAGCVCGTGRGILRMNNGAEKEQDSGEPTLGQYFNHVAEEGMDEKGG